jgi:hypothetical protein
MIPAGRKFMYSYLQQALWQLPQASPQQSEQLSQLHAAALVVVALSLDEAVLVANVRTPASNTKNNAVLIVVSFRKKFNCVCSVYIRSLLSSRQESNGEQRTPQYPPVLVRKEMN